MPPPPRHPPSRLTRKPSANPGTQRQIKPSSVRGHAHQQNSGPLQGVGHLQLSGVEGPHVQARDECGEVSLRFSVVAGEEHVEGLAVSDDAAENRVERLQYSRALGGDGGDLLGDGVARGRHDATGVGVERVGEVHENLAGQGVAVVPNHVDRAGVQNGEEHDVAGRGARERLLSASQPLFPDQGINGTGVDQLGAAVELQDPSHPARLFARDYKTAFAARLIATAREAGARDPEQLGEQLALLLDGASARSRVLNADSFATAAAIAVVLIDSALQPA